MALDARRRSTVSNLASARSSCLSNSKRCLLTLVRVLWYALNQCTSAKTPGSLSVTSAVSIRRREV